jgi:hypothetical protein
MAEAVDNCGDESKKRKMQNRDSNKNDSTVAFYRLIDAAAGTRDATDYSHRAHVKTIAE